MREEEGVGVRLQFTIHGCKTQYFHTFSQARTERVIWWWLCLRCFIRESGGGPMVWEFIRERRGAAAPIAVYYDY